MRVLAIDTSTEILSVALRQDGAVHSFTKDAGLSHSERLLPIIESILAEAGCTPADIELVAVSLGPGSFTGLRIGLATAKGISTALATPLVQVDNLAVYGRGCAPCNALVLPLIDAKKRKFYVAGYSGGNEVFGASDLTAEEVLHRIEGWERVIATGPHARLFMERISDTSVTSTLVLDPLHRRGIAPELIEPGIRAYQSHGPAAPDCAPRYIRRSDAELSLAPPEERTRIDE